MLQFASSSCYLFTTTTGEDQAACASLMTSDLTNVYSTSTLASSALPVNYRLTSLDKASLKIPIVWTDVFQISWSFSDNHMIVKLISQTATSSTPTSIKPRQNRLVLLLPNLRQLSSPPHRA